MRYIVSLVFLIATCVPARAQPDCIPGMDFTRFRRQWNQAVSSLRAGTWTIIPTAINSTESRYQQSLDGPNLRLILIFGPNRCIRTATIHTRPGEQSRASEVIGWLKLVATLAPTVPHARRNAFLDSVAPVVRAGTIGGRSPRKLGNIQFKYEEEWSERNGVIGAVASQFTARRAPLPVSSDTSKNH